MNLINHDHVIECEMESDFYDLYYLINHSIFWLYLEYKDETN